MKRDIILTMERELTDLKASLVNMVENTGTVRNFSDVVKSPSQVSHAQQLQRVVSDCSTIDKGTETIRGILPIDRRRNPKHCLFLMIKCAIVEVVLQQFHNPSKFKTSRLSLNLFQSARV